MRAVSPSVKLISRPQVDWTEVLRYLSEVGGRGWRAPEEYSDSQGLVEIGGRLCYRSWAPGLNANVTKVRTDQAEYLENILKSGHGSVLEHANWTFICQNVSRVFTHELVRHRAGCAYSQESMRFVRLTDIPFWFPEWSTKDTELMERAREVLAQLEFFQHWMAQHFHLDEEGVPFHEKKHKTSFMRRFAPDGVATSIMVTANCRAWRHIIEMRTSEAAEEEARLVVTSIAAQLINDAPLLFGDFTMNEKKELKPKYSKV